MKGHRVNFKLYAVAALAVSVFAATPSGSRPVVPASQQRTYEYAYYCNNTDALVHDSTETFTNVSNRVSHSLALVLHTVPDGESTPYAQLLDPTTPRFTAIDFDAKGNDQNTIAFCGVSNPNGLLDEAEWDVTPSQSTAPLRTTPTGYTHYRLLLSNSDFENTPIANNAKFNFASIIQEPDLFDPGTLSVANLALNSNTGLTNVKIVTAPAVQVCQYIE